MICVLTGGTGGAKMVDGLAQVVGQAHLTAVVNTADDDDFHGLRVCPDLDICTYTLAGVIDERGWGYGGDSFRCLEGLATYGRETWFGLGDRDLATHIHRTLLRAEGWALSEITRDICERLGVQARLVPMTDEDVRTIIHTPAGALRFEEYLVRDGAAHEIDRIELAGIDEARPAPGVLEAIDAAQTIVIAPSSPVVSIGTILAVPGVRAGLAARRERVVGVSPIIGEAPVEGPGHKFLRGVGETTCTAETMARRYADVCGSFLIHDTDRDRAGAVAAHGPRPVVCDILMPDRPARARLAERVLAEVA